MTENRSHPLVDIDRVVAAGTVLAAGLVVALYGLRTVALLTYPYDWAPDEGLFLDYARRLINAPSTLYPVEPDVTPAPLYWTPLLPALLAPVASLTNPLQGARIIMLLVAIALFVILARLASRERRALSLVAVALVLAPMSWAFLLVRMDLLSWTCWLAGAIVLLPERIEHGSASLSWGRAVVGGTLLLASILAKQTAVVLATPIVAVWLFVDVRSFSRVATVMVTAGLTTLVALEVATSGGFLRSTAFFWTDHPVNDAGARVLLMSFASSNAAVLIFAALGLLVGLALGPSRRDPALVLVIGALLQLPMLRKFGAGTHYLVPLALALAIAGTRAWAPYARIGLPFGILLALVTATTREYDGPNESDRATARWFYDLVEQRGQVGPIFGSLSSYAYVVAHQPVEAEQTALTVLHRVDPSHGTVRAVTSKVVRSEYALVLAHRVWNAAIGPMNVALLDRYRWIASCELRQSIGPLTLHLFVPRETEMKLDAPTSPARCQSDSGVPREFIDAAERYERGEGDILRTSPFHP